MNLLSAIILVLLIPSSLAQLSQTESTTLFQLQKLLEYPQVLQAWNNWTNFCFLPPSPSLKIVCSNGRVTELTVIGNRTSPSSHSSETFQALSGTFSTDSFFTVLTKLSNLKILSLVSLGLWGPLPAKINRFSSLEILNISSNFISGEVPDSISSMKNLKSIVLADNLLNGNVPDLKGLSSLEEVNLDGNKFGPEFPSIGNNIVKLILRKNLITSQIPPGVSNFEKLQIFDVSSNNLVGRISISIFSLPSLRYLDLSSNKLSGNISTNSLCSSSWSLNYVDISHNFLVGKLPSCMVKSKAKVLYSWNCLSKKSLNDEQHSLSYCKKDAALAVRPPKRKVEKGSSVKLGLVLVIVGGVVGVACILALIIVFVLWKSKPERLNQNVDRRSVAHKVSEKSIMNARHVPQTMRLGTHGQPPYNIFTEEEIVFLITSICCAIVSISFFTIGLLNFIDKSEQLKWLTCFIRGIIWVSFSVSLMVQRIKWIRILNSIWWLSSCVLVSSLNIEILFRNHGIQIFDIVSWLVHFLLLYCAIQNLGYFGTPSVQQGLSEPLLDKQFETKQTGLGQATVLSKLVFSWMNSLFSLGYSKPLDLDEIPSLVSEDEANTAYQKFVHAWESLVKERPKNNRKNLVLWSIVRTYLRENILIAFYGFITTVSVAVSPLILYAFVKYSNRAEADFRQALSIVGFLIVTKVFETLSQRHWFFNSRRSGLKMRSALMVAVYQKQLKLSSSARTRHSAGEIVNYIAVDSYRMGEFPWWFHITWISVLQLVLSIGVLYGVVGIGALPGLVPLIICGFLNVPFAKILQICQSQFMIAQDERLRSTSEILNSMKIIKLQSWEEKFKNLVQSLRDKEFVWLSKTQILKASGTFIYWMSPTVISAVVFIGCAVTKSAPLNAETIFTILATLRNLGEPVRMIPEALSIMIQVKVSFDRLNNFLLDEELNNDDSERKSKEGSVNAVEIQDGNFIWDRESVSPTLADVNLEIKWRHKIAVCGPVGAGKSSLLYAILGEVPKISGTVNIGGTFAYVSQSSWIQSGTVQDNILFGKPMDRTRYEKAIKACALDKDINDFSHGDLTEIGQRGINLSGGQKQRIQLARAVYNDADIYLLDDPFSAVDAHTAAILFNDCVMTALREKTVILVTHQVEFLSEVDTILVMEGGKVIQSGSYESLLTAGTAFELLVSAHKDTITELDQDSEHKRGSEIEVLSNPQISHGFYLTKNESEGEISSIKGPIGVQLTQEEEKMIGNDGWKSFWDYINYSKGTFLLCFILLAQSGFIALQTASTFWLSIAIEIPTVTNATLIGFYTLVSFASTAFAYVRSYLTALLGLKASTTFFSSFTTAIFNAPMHFFDSTPVGRILTRASSDLTILDFDIPYSITFVLCVALEIVVIICIMVSVTWQVLIVAVPAMIASIYIQQYYQATARELIRINGTTKAPVMNFAAETSLGVVTVRAFNMVDKFFKNYLTLVDTDASLFFHSNAAMEWLVLRIEALQNLTVITGSLLLILLPHGYVSPGLVGLSLSYAFTLTSTQIFWSRWFSNLSNYIVSVERIKQFIHIPAEPPAIVDNNRPPSSWPSKGRIDLQGLEIKYRLNAPLVLKGITCTFKEGSRVGVVGRTGSGKSTLISALFRLVEPSRGDIFIDGMNICSMGLKDLRMKLSIIPQEPTLFKGSIRTNLDPLGLYSDDDIWKAIEKCQLKETISKLPSLLDSSVSDEGGNWSLGQRQLFCLGRVLLKRNRILVLDEATASIDSATDAILQRVIRQEFEECTVITIAHRVPTVIDSDMVMVLSYGKLMEYDEPSKLMETNSSFSKLVAEYWSSFKKNSLADISRNE